MTALVVVSDAGPSSTVQDAGRFGAGHLGVAPAGAADADLYALAAALVAAPGLAAIEFTAAGPTLLVERGPVLAAVVGDAAVAIDGRAASAWRGHWLEAGQRIAVGALARGWRGYVAFGGGVEVAPVLGSRSTHVSSGVGPQGGRRLAAGDRLAVGAPATDREWAVDRAAVPVRAGPIALVWTDDAGWLAPGARKGLCDSEWKVDAASDRMAVCLTGPALALGAPLDRPSRPTVDGSVQIPGDGRPRLLLCDRQTIGGYIQPAVVASCDRGRVAQARPSETVRFEAVEVEAAQSAWRAQRAAWQRCLASLTPAWPPAARALLGRLG